MKIERELQNLNFSATLPEALNDSGSCRHINRSWTADHNLGLRCSCKPRRFYHGAAAYDLVPRTDQKSVQTRQQIQRGIRTDDSDSWRFRSIVRASLSHRERLNRLRLRAVGRKQGPQICDLDDLGNIRRQLTQLQPSAGRAKHVVETNQNAQAGAVDVLRLAEMKNDLSEFVETGARNFGLPIDLGFQSFGLGTEREAAPAADHRDLIDYLAFECQWHLNVPRSIARFSNDSQTRARMCGSRRFLRTAH